jgi:hypothetical protein
MKTKEDVDKALLVLSDYINVMGHDNTSDGNNLACIVTEFLAKEHRTIQQSIMKTFIQVVINYSKFGTDDRNKYTVNSAKTMTDSIASEMYDYRYFAPFV